MAGTHSIRTRIKSLESILQMTGSMKTVAATRLRRNQMKYMRLRPYAENSRRLLEEVAAGEESRKNELLAGRGEIKKRCYVLFVGNRGMCGVYNHNLVHYLSERLMADGAENFLVICGRWKSDALGRIGPEIRRVFDEFSDTPDPAQAQQLSDYLSDLYTQGEADEIVLVHQRYQSVMIQNPGMYTLLPVDASGSGQGRDFICEPDRDRVLLRLIKHYIDNTVYAALLEAGTGEQAARMTAMTSASDNAEELIRQLRLKLNHLRQSAITTEIAEIAGGSEAMGSKE